MEPELPPRSQEAEDREEEGGSEAVVHRQSILVPYKCKVGTQMHPEGPFISHSDICIRIRPLDYVHMIMYMYVISRDRFSHLSKTGGQLFPPWYVRE